MRIPTRPPDPARMARAKAELGRIEARLKRDALKADVIARIVSDTAKNKDVLDRPAVFAALTQDPDSMVELARQAGWLAEETPATGTEMRRAGTLLGSLLNAFQIPSRQAEVELPLRAKGESFVRPHREAEILEDSAVSLDWNIAASRLPSAIPAVEFPYTVASVQEMPQQSPAIIDGRENTDLPARIAFPIQAIGHASLGFFFIFVLLGAGIIVWFNL